MSISTIQIQLSVLVQYKVEIIIISLKINLFSWWYSWKIVGIKQQSLTLKRKERAEIISLNNIYFEKTSTYNLQT
jgi:hypothetical protein